MTTSAASTSGAQQFNQSVRLRMQAAADAAKPREVAEVDAIAEACLADYNARQQAARDKEKADITAGRLKIL